MSDQGARPALIATSTPIAAYGIAFAAVCLFSIEAALAKAIGPGIDVAQVAAIRCIVQFAFLALWLRGGFRAAWHTDRPWMHVNRGLLSATGTAAYFYVFANLPLATATVLFFTGVLFTTVGAGVFLGEAVGWRRWSATIVGFCGALLVLRPAEVSLDLPLAAAMFLALNAAAINLTTKDLTRTESRATIMLWIAGTTLVVAIPWVALTSTVVSWTEYAMMLGIGLAGTLGQFAAIRVNQIADLSATAPILYVRIVIAGVIGTVVFGEHLDATWFAGAALVTGSALYITLRETQLARRPAITRRPEG